MFNNLNPIFNEAPAKKRTNSSSQRKTRIDKKHPVRIPVAEQTQFKFRRALKVFKNYYPDIRISQTEFNTCLLSYALQHPEIINWELEYKGSDTYMTTKLLKNTFEAIGGANGIALIKGLSERKTVYMMTVSSLLYIEKGGYYDEIVQQIQSVKGKA
jgi:hypothetical protein